MLKVTLRGLRAHVLRLLLTIVAVMVSVTFMTGTQVLTATIRTSFDKVFDDVFKDIDAVVRSTVEVDTGFGKIRQPIDENVIPTVASVDGVAAVEGQVSGNLTIIDKNGEPIGIPNAGPPTFGFNWLTEPALNGWRIIEGRPPTASTELVLDKKSADKAGYKIGDKIKVQINTGVKDFTVVGTAGFGSTDNYAGSAAVLFETTTAQQLLTKPGLFSYVIVAGDDGVSQEELRNRIATVLPPQTQVITGAAFTAEFQDVFRKIFDILGTVLLVFGLIALFVGAFIIYNTFNIIVTQRTKELALLRAMGAARGQVLGSVASEALIVGAFASFLGLIAGIGLAALLSFALSNVGDATAIGSLSLPPQAFAISFLVGTLVTLLSGLYPAWRASRVPPIAAMRDVSIDTTGRSVPRLAVGLVLLVVGLVALYLGLFSKTTIGVGSFELGPVALVGVSFGGVFLGLVALGPLFAAPLSRAIGSPLRSFVGHLARANAMRNPKRTSSTAAALMIGVTLVVVFALLIESFKVSFNAAVDKTFLTDLVITSGTFLEGGIDVETNRQIEQIPGVASSTGLEGSFATVDGKPAQVVGGDIEAFSTVIKITPAAGTFRDLGVEEVAVSQQDAEANNWTLDSLVPFVFPEGGSAMLRVGAIYEAADIPGGLGYLMSAEAFATHFPPQQQGYKQIFVKVAPGTNPKDVQAQIKPIIKKALPTATVEDISEFKQSQLGFLNVFLAIVTVMLIIAIFIAVLGIVNTLLLSVYERTREIGLLRAVGATRAQVRKTVRWESVIFSLQGTAIGTAIGFGFGFAIVKAISIDNPITFAVPWVLLIGMVVVSLAAGVLAAVLPAFTASRLDVLEAIATE